MAALSLRPTHKPVKEYYAALQRFTDQGVKHEGAVKSAFHSLLETCARQRDWTLIPEFEIRRPKQRPLRADAALVNKFNITHGFWEAKDSQDDLEKEARKKFALGYPQDNILFQAPSRAMLFQDRQLVLDADLTKPEALLDALNAFFAYTPPAYEQWETAVGEFQQRVPELGQGLKDIIEAERKTNQRFVTAFTEFAALCRASLNPNLRDEAIEEMLIQHLLTERLFRTVFKNPDFVQRNVVAQQIERVIDALASKSFSRAEFLQKLDRFYRAIEDTAATITDFSQKQKFLNTVYEKFFQGFCVKVADTLGIVYTPPPIVRFMVNSVEHLLKEHFGKSLGSANVHILDPFAGTGNFHVHLMQHIPKTALAQKYAHELWANEILLLPYYVCCMNIEHAYYEATGEYLAFPGACLVDTFETAESKQVMLFTEENTQRVQRQKEAPIFIVLSNPPYNTNQANENDNNKNRKYEYVDERVRTTYVAASKATLRNKLGDPYIEAFRWASDRIGEEGIVAFVSNNSFLDEIAFDGVRKYLAQEFDEIYLLNLTGNVRKNPKLSGTTHNVFGIQVGVSINFFVRRQTKKHKARIHYARTDEGWRKEQKYRFLDDNADISRVKWCAITPDENYTWLREGLRDEFADFLPIGSKITKRVKVGGEEAIFKTYSLGVATNRDPWVYSFNLSALQSRVSAFVEIYQATLDRVKRNQPKAAEDVIDTADTRIKWTRQVKTALLRHQETSFEPNHIRVALYRPFTKLRLYFDDFWNEERYQQHLFFPTPETENRSIVVSDHGYRSPHSTLMVNAIPELHLCASTDGFQCFPFYTYAEDGTHRRENITDWALEQFRTHYKDKRIGKWDIFHYVYAVLHHPQYRERYAANLRRELPRVPFVGAAKSRSGGPRSVVADADVFWKFVEAGRKLAELHVGYEQQPEYPLQRIEAKGEKLNWRVEKMRLSKDKTAVIYNDFLTLAGIPNEAFDYRLGNRSALAWVIDQYQVSTDKRSGITNDPNRPDDEQYIVRLIGQVINVSVETVKMVKGLPPLS